MHVSFTIDINECTANMHNCSERMDCNNTIGSYKCMCKKGYMMGSEEECQGICKEDWQL